MANMQFDLVSPERMLASFEATEVEIPGAEGDFTAMPDHQALVTSMRPGVLKATGADTAEFVVSGGFVEVSATSVSVLAEIAVPRGEINRETLDAMIAEAESAAAEATPEMKDSADKQVADIRELATILSL